MPGMGITLQHIFIHVKEQLLRNQSQQQFIVRFLEFAYETLLFFAFMARSRLRQQLIGKTTGRSTAREPAN